MKCLASAAIAATMLTFNAWASDAPPVEEVKAVAGGYAKQLKSALQESMSKNGPAASLSVCSERAAQLGADVSNRSGWSVKRVSTQARNPLDMPDIYEAANLDQFDALIASGKEDASSYKVVTEGGVRYARFMKAIRIEPVCLTCHGGNEVPRDVEKRLSELYPHDSARGYKLGDLRGALSIRVKLD